MNIKLLYIGLIVLFFSSCLKEELPVPMVKMSSKEASVTMGSDYDYQIFFDLSQHKVTEKNTKYSWDIAFENGSNGHHIILNHSKNMFLYRTGKTNLDEVMKSTGYTSQIAYFDLPSMNLDSTAYGDLTNGKVRLIDMGYNSNGDHLGWYKIKVVATTSSNYTFRYAEISSTDFKEVIISKEDNIDYSFIYFSLKDNHKVAIAPKNKDWDLLFTQYIQSLWDGSSQSYLSYLVTGVLINRHNGVEVATTTVPFNEVKYENVIKLSFTNKANGIGYGWKEYNFDTQKYEIIPDRTYIIKDYEGRYFKLRFVDFYSSSGEKGTPVFEYEELL